MTAGGGASGLFGIWRLALAVMVVWGYLAPGFDHLLPQAAFLFVLLSGYVTAELLLRAYLPLAGGVKLYYRQRAARLYWLYLPVLFFALAVAYGHSYITLGIHPAYFYQPPLEDGYSIMLWLRNLSVVGVPGIDGDQVTPSFLPVVWGVGIEAACWVVAPLLLRRRWALYAFAGAGALWIEWLLWSLQQDMLDQTWRMLHFGLFTGMLPFAGGMILRLKRQEGWRRLPWVAGVIGLAAYSALVLDVFSRGTIFRMQGLTAALAAGAVVTYWLGGVRLENAPYWLRGLDRCCGQMAFPLVLVHMPVAALITIISPEMYYFFHDKLEYRQPWELLAMTLPVSLLVSLLLGYGVEAPLSRRRKRQREKTAQTSVMTPI